MIAQKKTLEVIQGSDLYELFEETTMKGIDGADVQVLQSIGTFSLRDLTQQKTYLETQIGLLQTKIDLITALA